MGKPKATLLDLSKLFVLDRTLMPLTGGQRTPAVLPGDWDLPAYPLAEKRLDLRKPVIANSQPPVRDVPVIIGRQGDVISAVSAQELFNGYIHNEQAIRVRVVGRHQVWDEFRKEIIEFTKDEDGLVYAPLTHVDLQDIKSWNGPDRFDAIAKHISPEHKTVLDVGANFGYMCEQLEKTGRRCFAVEIDPTYYYFLSKLKRAQLLQFETFNEDIFEYVEKYHVFDTILSLAVFHHFIKTERGLSRLVRLLKKLRMGAMFFWAHNPQEKQMRGAYRNYKPCEFAKFIVENSCLTHFRAIGEFNFRTLFHLWC